MPIPPALTPSQYAVDEPPLLSRQREPTYAGGDDLAADCAVTCIAAFFPDESTMRDAARSLLRQHGLKVSQLVLMGPRDADPARFVRKTRRWTGRWTSGGGDGSALPQLLAIAAGLATLTLAIGWWVLESETPLLATLVGLVVLVLAGALLGDRWLWPWTEPPRVRRFETSVHQQLTQGLWALVVHHIPRDRQSGAVTLLRGTSLRWCAVARPAVRL